MTKAHLIIFHGMLARGSTLSKMLIGDIEKYSGIEETTCLFIYVFSFKAGMPGRAATVLHDMVNRSKYTISILTIEFTR